MTQFINNSEINSLLFDHKREEFKPSSSTSTLVSFKDVSNNTILARFYALEKKSPNIIFFPSATTPLQQYDKMAASYNQQGINVLILSYRGDNGSAQISTLSDFYLDARAVFNQAISYLADMEYVGAKFVMGQSIGSVLAIDLAYHNPDLIKGLLLESVMCQTTEYLNSHGIATAEIPDLEENGFQNLKKIEKIELPTLIFHGARDQWTPIAEAEKLQASSGARTKQFFIIPGALHENIHENAGPLYFETIKNFIDTLCGVNTWRQKRREHIEAREK
ncbi:MAG: alpha-beta hydrolase superfamily lysophospholipase [Desulforhopalus sp.]|jgi:alpha-beta hydrolase superfamily lysophospholipase